MSLMGDFAKVEPPISGDDLVVGSVPTPAAAPEQPKPTVTVDKDGNIAIR